MVSLSSIINTILLLFYEPSGRGWDPSVPDIGLPSGSEVGIGLIIALIVIPIGFLIIKGGDNNKGESGNSAAGCLGMIFIGGGIVALLPTLAWVFSILSAMYAIGIIILVVIVIIALIYSFFSKK